MKKSHNIPIECQILINTIDDIDVVLFVIVDSSNTDLTPIDI